MSADFKSHCIFAYENIRRNTPPLFLPFALLRELMLTGVVRRQDIEADNSISHERIAEMRRRFARSAI